MDNRQSMYCYFTKVCRLLTMNLQLLTTPNPKEQFMQTTGICVALQPRTTLGISELSKSWSPLYML